MEILSKDVSRRGFLSGASLAALSLTTAARAQDSVNLPLFGGGGLRSLTEAFPGKGEMILQRTRPPLLETPMEVFDKNILTPNDRFYVRWHWANIPTDIDADRFTLAVHGHVTTERMLSLKDLLAMPSVEMVAVNQCSGNSRGFFEPRVPGAEWGNGAMGNARWTGVRLKDVLDKAGVKAGAVAVRFRGLDEPVLPGGPHFMKSFDIDHASDGEVMIAYAMNGEQLPLLNGFPLRLIVPGWYATYWVKMLCDIEVLEQPDDNFWTTKAYLIPDTPRASIKPGQTGVKTVPITRMPPRSFVTNITSGSRVESGGNLPLRGIAFGGTAAVRSVDLSLDHGATWLPANLGRDAEKYGFRRWEASAQLPAGQHEILVRCTNADGETQPLEANWNPSGFMRNQIEAISLSAV